VKCSKCTHIWVQNPIDFNDEKFQSLLKIEQKPTDKLPAKYKPVKFKLSYAICLVILLTAAVTLEIFKKPEEYPQLSNMFGLDDFNGLRFHNFKVEGKRNDNKMDFFLNGSIINTTDKTAPLPIIAVTAYSKGKIKLEQSSIEPFDQLDIAPEITKISGGAYRLELSFENWLESAMR
jgi:hypothetical protein